MMRLEMRSIFLYIVQCRAGLLLRSTNARKRSEILFNVINSNSEIHKREHTIRKLCDMSVKCEIR
jgi:hypothetical protein